jgi:hypothetical protein
MTSGCAALLFQTGSMSDVWSGNVCHRMKTERPDDDEPS